MSKSIYKFLITALIFSLFSFDFPKKVLDNLEKAGNNRIELENVLNHYKNDSLKFKAACFLIENMDIHYSNDYFWADTTNNKINFNEVDYPDYKTSQFALTELKKNFSGVHPIPIIRKDIECINSKYLINNIDNAFNYWNSKVKYYFEDFCEYILPYRIADEPLQDWRKIYTDKYKWLKDSLYNNNSTDPINFVFKYVYSNFTDTYKREKKTEPIDRIGALQLLHRMRGACEDIADFEIFILRSQGFLSAYDNIPYWATSSGGHSLASVWLNEKGKNLTLDIQRVDSIPNKQLRREPSKVIRNTYSKQPNVLANFLTPEKIPENFLRRLNYKDITSEYWPVTNFESKLIQPISDSIVFACVLNYHSWRPTWWANVKNNIANFENMPTGVVYLPTYFKQGSLVPAGYPVAVGQNNKLELKPDTLKQRSIEIKEQEKYLKFRPYNKYTLFYWDTNWKKIATLSTTDFTEALQFKDVPLNALLILIPEYSTRLERPFIITNEGQRVWF